MTKMDIVALLLSGVSLTLSGYSLILSGRHLVERYQRDKAHRITLGAPPANFWHVLRGRGFWKDEEGQWHNE